ncbi:MAG TPA: hypothetical protein VEH78_01335 [Pseudolabrys sp.]|nr:hypothetical protein [Pseudolabrys sp.]
MSEGTASSDERLPPKGNPEGNNIHTLNAHLGTAAMQRFGVPRREANEKGSKAAQLNWRRGLLRVWLLVSAAWIMGWIVYLILYGIRSGFQGPNEFLSIPVLLIGPPIALLLFGLLAGWAFRGFKPEQ